MGSLWDGAWERTEHSNLAFSWYKVASNYSACACNTHNKFKLSLPITKLLADIQLIDGRLGAYWEV